jgi:hypothetical protein
MYAYEHDVPIDAAIYAKIMDKLGSAPIPGQLLHLAVERPEGGLHYIEVWESREACEKAFCDRIHPAVFAVFKEIDFRPQGEPVRKELSAVDLWLDGIRKSAPAGR